MGNRLSSLPFPTWVGGTVDCGLDPATDGPVHSPRRWASSTTATASSTGLSHFAEGSEDATVRAESVMLGNEDDIKPLLYASAFVLQTIDSKRYMQAGAGSDGGRLNCLHGPEIKASSLLTFHGRGGDQVNYRGDQDFTKVEDGACVTLYANARIESNLGSVGRYLAQGPTNDSENIDNDQKDQQQASSSSSKKMYWRGDPNSVKATPEAFEFVVRRAVDPKSRPSPSRSQSIRNKLRIFPFPATSRRDSASSLSNSTCASRSERGARTPPPERATSSWSEEGSLPRPTTPSTLQLQQRRQQRNEAIAQGGHVESDPANSTDESSAVSDASKLLGEYLFVGDTITLESKSRPGYFLVAKSNGLVQLSANDASGFTISVPKLKFLLELSQQQESTALSADGGASATGPSKFLNLTAFGRPKPILILSESEMAWLRLLQELPLDIVYRILQYKGGWVKVARSVSREWCRAATLHVHRIRINGDFHSIDEPDERKHMLEFIYSCSHLTNLTLRNVDDLKDQDLALLVKCKYLRSLSLGGCRDLTDASLPAILSLNMLKVVNLATTKITDAGLELIGNAKANFTILNLYGCRLLTQAGIAKVLSLPSLESLNIRGCNLDKPMTDNLQQRFPKVKLLVGPASIDGIY